MTGKRRTGFARAETGFHRNTKEPLFGCPFALLHTCEVFMKARILTISFFAATSLFAAESSTDTRIRHSMEAFQDAINSPDKGIPLDLLKKAQCVVIVPDLMKGAFFVGGKYGRGFASCRHGGGWSSPAAARIEGGSFGLQLGGSSTDLIMLVMNRRGMDRLLGDKFTIGADVEGAAGPVGRETSAQTDAVLHAEILTWSRARGLFGGISLEGATLRPDSGENQKLYGREISNREILQTGVPTPTAGKPFVAMLNRQSSPARTPGRSQK
jgi:SH3 domain-containing YSC84-like protein 1